MQTNNSEQKKGSLYSIASAQQGYFTSKQALAAGYSHRLQHYHKENGDWREVGWGIYRLAHYPTADQEDLVRRSLWSRNRDDVPQAVISHETALEVHELSDLMPGRIHLTVPPNFRKKPTGGCVLHKKTVPADSVEKRDGYNVTTPLQTIIDVAEADISPEHLEQALRDSFNRGILMPVRFQKAVMSNTVRNKINKALNNIKKNPFA